LRRSSMGPGLRISRSPASPRPAAFMGAANRSPPHIEPVSRMPKRKLENGERRLAPQSHQSSPDIPRICRPETPARQPNPRECRRFSHTRKKHSGDRTGWLGWEDSNSQMRFQNWPLKCGPNFPSFRNVWRSETFPGGAAKE